MFKAVKSTACLRGSARKKHLHMQNSDGSTPKTTPERKRLSCTSSETPSIASKWYTWFRIVQTERTAKANRTSKEAPVPAPRNGIFVVMRNPMTAWKGWKKQPHKTKASGAGNGPGGGIGGGRRPNIG